MILTLAIIAIVVLAGVVVFTTARRRDTNAAMGSLSRETLKRDRSRDVPADIAPPPVAATGREVERVAVLERTTTGRAVVVAPAAKPPAPAGPVDPETLGVTRRQFLNRGSIALLGLGLSGFGAAALSFLWPSSSGGFGGKVSIPDNLQKILEYYDQNKTPYYYAPGRVYISPYPKADIDKASKVYSGGVLAGMEQGVVALYQKCVHLGCRVPWCKTSQWFECPCHGSKYSRVGEQKGGPAPRGLDRFPVAISGGAVSVDTGLVVQGPPLGTNTTGQEAEGPHCVTVGE